MELREEIVFVGRGLTTATLLLTTLLRPDIDIVRPCVKVTKLFFSSSLTPDKISYKLFSVILSGYLNVCGASLFRQLLSAT
jgi:hypothetical protein